MSDCTHQHQTRAACCPLHFIAGGFAMANAPAADVASEPVSFGDATPKQASDRCNADRSSTEGLYERLLPNQTLVFRGARVVTMKGDEVLLDQDVSVRAGRIESVRQSGGDVPDGALVIDAAGKTLIPGLSEIHAHIFTVNWSKSYSPMLEDSEDGSEYVLPYDLTLFLMLANGITKVEIMAGCPETLWMRDSVLDGSLVGPRLSVGSPLIDGPAPMHGAGMSYRVGDREGGLRAADEIARMGFDFAKPYSLLTADGYEGLMEGCRKHGIRVMGHVPTAIGIEKGIEMGQGGIAHAAEFFYWEQGPERHDPERMRGFAQKMAEAGTYLQATMVVVNRFAWKTGNADEMDVPDRAWMNPLQTALWREGSPMLEMMRSRKEFEFIYDRTFELTTMAVKAAREAGVRVLTGTDFPNPFVVEGFSLHEELQLLVEEAGYTPHEVLHASTRQTAEYHGEGPADGTISAGGVAELVLIDGDPLDDIKATRRIDTVLARDALLRKPAIAEGLRRVRKAYDAMPPVSIVATQNSPYAPTDPGAS